ncbi:MAG TPA: Hsp20/alpha crystallin family protein [Chloroflexota bacterium]|jgi:HSP20 family protein
MANLVRWDPYGDMLSLRSAMDRLFEDAWVRPFGRIATNGGPATLAVDVYETDNDVVVEANVPGVKPEDIDISIQGDTLTIKGESHADEMVDDDKFHMRERRFTSFHRQLMLPRPVKSDAAEAEFKDGVLKLSIPKAEEARERKIPVKTTPGLHS